MNRTQRSGALLVLVSAAGYAFFPIFSKAVFDSGLSPLDLLAWRFLIAAPLIWLLLFTLRTPAPAAPLPRFRLMAMGVLFGISSATALYSLTRLPASVYTAVLYTYPAMVALFSLFFGERLSSRSWLALGMTLIGMLMTVPDISQNLQGGDLIGVAFALANAASYAVYIVLSSRILRGHTALARASAWSISGSCVMMIAIIMLRGLVLPSNAAGWGSLLALVSISTVAPIFAFYAGMQKVGPARAAIISTVEPLLTVLLAVALRGETLVVLQIVGGALILLSVLVLQTQHLLPRRPIIEPVAGD
jgi:drug/metabolite transporter (DMT)-like permease